MLWRSPPLFAGAGHTRERQMHERRPAHANMARARHRPPHGDGLTAAAPHVFVTATVRQRFGSFLLCGFHVRVHRTRLKGGTVFSSTVCMLRVCLRATPTPSSSKVGRLQGNSWQLQTRRKSAKVVRSIECLARALPLCAGAGARVCARTRSPPRSTLETGAAHSRVNICEGLCGPRVPPAITAHDLSHV